MQLLSWQLCQVSAPPGAWLPHLNPPASLPSHPPSRWPTHRGMEQRVARALAATELRSPGADSAAPVPEQCPGRPDLATRA